MSSMFHQAVQKQFGAALVCPKCKADNYPPSASPMIRIDFTATRAECVNCSYEAPLDRFQKKEPR